MLIRSLVVVLAASWAWGQASATLETADTELVFEAGASSPKLTSLKVPGQPKWTNHSSEGLIPFVEISERQTPITWKLDLNASETGRKRVAFVYESANPHLRLTWEWRVPENYGPIEHQIRIQNLEPKELWIPLQDSLAFRWQVAQAEPLEHMFVEKGANTPSPIGTHEASMGEGYRWTGTSSTYGDLDQKQPREIIPWSLVERADGTHTGWYLGIEFSGCTRIALRRQGDALELDAGLNPEPAPFRSKLVAGGSFESPTVFLGGFRDGADGAGNVLRRWVRAVLGNPLTWKDPNYPLVVNNSWGGGMEVNEEIARRMIRDSAELGVDMFHIDAGWFRGVGDWYPHPQKFPHGLAAIADDAHQHGLRFGVWVDWTQAGLSTEPGAPMLAIHGSATGW